MTQKIHPLSTLSKMILFIFVIIFLIQFFKHKKYTFKFIKIGVFFASVVLLTKFITILAMPELLEIRSIFTLILNNLLLFIRNTLIVSIGIYYTHYINIPQIPLLRSYNNHNNRIISKKYFISAAIILSASIVYTIIIFKLTAPSISSSIKNIQEIIRNKMNFSGDFHIGSFIGLITIAISEELIFRLGIQSFFAKIINSKYNHLLAIFIATIFWTISHSGMLEPNYIKLIQVFPIGLSLGYLYKKYGIENSIFTHSIFNIIVVLLYPFLFN